MTRVVGCHIHHCPQCHASYAASAYASIPLQIPTDRCTPEQIVARLEDALAANDEVAGMNRISVATPEGTTYHICVADGLLGRVGR